MPVKDAFLVIPGLKRTSNLRQKLFQWCRLGLDIGHAEVTMRIYFAKALAFFKRVEWLDIMPIHSINGKITNTKVVRFQAPKLFDESEENLPGQKEILEWLKKMKQAGHVLDSFPNKSKEKAKKERSDNNMHSNEENAEMKNVIETAMGLNDEVTEEPTTEAVAPAEENNETPTPDEKVAEKPNENQAQLSDQKIGMIVLQSSINAGVAAEKTLNYSRNELPVLIRNIFREELKQVSMENEETKVLKQEMLNLQKEMENRSAAIEEAKLLQSGMAKENEEIRLLLESEKDRYKSLANEKDFLLRDIKEKDEKIAQQEKDINHLKELLEQINAGLKTAHEADKQKSAETEAKITRLMDKHEKLLEELKKKEELNAQLAVEKQKLNAELKSTKEALEKAQKDLANQTVTAEIAEQMIREAKARL